jgi:uncharacterized phiE125 gp8 family phage protein
MRLKKLEDAIEEPVTVEQVKSDLILTGDADDDLIEEWIVAFRQLIESHVKQSLLTQEWRLYFRPDELDDDNRITLPRPPIQSIEEVTFVDGDGLVEVLVVTDDYRLEDEDLVLIDSYDDGSLTVDYYAGYETTEEIPQPILQAIRNSAAAHYENREMFVLPPAVKMQVAPYRRGRLL